MREQRERDTEASDVDEQSGDAAHVPEGDHRTRFTSSGHIPPVAHGDGPRGPSASDRAYGPGEGEHGSSPHSFSGPSHLRVAVSGLNVRSSATQQADNIVGGFHKGYELDGLEREGDWIRIMYRGAPAYVHGNFVEIAPVKSTTGETAGVVDATGGVLQAIAHGVATAQPQATNAAPQSPAHVAPAASQSVAQAAPAAAPPEVHAAVDPATALRTEKAAILAEFDAGHDQDAAMRRFVQFDFAHNGGMPSTTGIVLMGELARDLEQHASQHVTTTAPTAAPAAAPAAAAAPVTPTTAAPATATAAITHAVATGEKPPEGSFTPNTADHTAAETPYNGTMDDRGGKKLDDTSYMAHYNHLAGGESLADHPTQPDEAELLNKIRVDSRKLDSVSLRTLQESLGVKNATGAMNTETLRKMQHKKGFSFEALMSGRLFGGDLKIVEAGGNGFGPHGNGHALRDTSAIAQGERKADAMAKVAGFASYQEMNDQFTDLELFGQPLGQGLPFLAERLKLADAYLRQRIPEAAGVTDQARLQQIAQEKLQWDGTAQGAYSASVEDIAKASGGKYGAHFHASGLAIDINPAQNPYVFTTGAMTVHTKNGNEKSIDGHLADNLRYAAQIFGGEEITPHTMKQWSEQYSSEELAAKIDMVSHSLTQYLQLCETGTDDQIELRFRNAGYSAEQAKALVPEAKHFARTQAGKTRYWQDNMSRKKMNGLTTHSMELIVALRDVAGLSWGGTELSEGANGDFMHFDCRHTTVGQKLFQFTMHNRGAEPTGAVTHDHDQPAQQHGDHDPHRGPEHH